MEAVNEKLRELQLEEIKTLKKTIKFFDDNNIRYYAIGGTLLGAVRHHGFIPWDDDIDLGVIREDYDRLAELSKTSDFPLNIVGPWNDENCYWYPARIVSDDVKVCRNVHGEDVIQNVWIDVFPLDGIPADSSEQRAYWLKLDYFRGRFNLSRLQKYEKGPSKLKNILKKGWMIFNNPKKMNKAKEYHAFDGAMKKYGFKDMPCFLNAEGRCKMREIAPQEWLGENFMLQFEDMQLRCIEHYDEYLTQIYGNYMEKPKNPEIYEHNIKDVIRK